MATNEQETINAVRIDQLFKLIELHGQVMLGQQKLIGLLSNRLEKAEAVIEAMTIGKEK